ncbi:MAG: hypothetical protein GY749_46630 [Desulfobacteraceae bacterium]|nr:hypothetical protein [Desulfobacteraceae bacterium]
MKITALMTGLNAFISAFPVAVENIRKITGYLFGKDWRCWNAKMIFFSWSFTLTFSLVFTYPYWKIYKKTRPYVNSFYLSHTEKFEVFGISIDNAALYINFTYILLFIACTVAIISWFVGHTYRRYRKNNIIQAGDITKYTDELEKMKSRAEGMENALKKSMNLMSRMTILINSSFCVVHVNISMRDWFTRNSLRVTLESHLLLESLVFWDNNEIIKKRKEGEFADIIENGNVKSTVSTVQFKGCGLQKYIFTIAFHPIRNGDDYLMLELQEMIGYNEGGE